MADGGVVCEVYKLGGLGACKPPRKIWPSENVADANFSSWKHATKPSHSAILNSLAEKGVALPR